MDKQTIIEKRFTRSIEGYDIEEVDAFLDEVAREFDRRDAALNVARLRIKLLLGEMESHGLIPKRTEQNADRETPEENEAGCDAPDEGQTCAAESEEAPEVTTEDADTAEKA